MLECKKLKNYILLKKFYLLLKILLKNYILQNFLPKIIFKIKNIKIILYIILYIKFAKKFQFAL